ncbi:hypothetical protein OG563_07695 [Nocardia vinacea]|uniref:Uncharacterized protein n=1 Tax=Nocardia vinacea TaxID=96468 RepID=A0ABZ1YXR0_9NOCA|nr:hypothetical protein [Nocardia vinacea]
MNRIAISMTMLIPPLFLLSLALAQPVSAAPRNGGAPVAVPWGPAAIAAPARGFPGSGVVFGECTGSACSAGGGPARVPDPLRAAPLVVNISPGAPDVNVAPDAARVNLAPGTLGVDIAPNALRVNIAPDALRVNVSSDGLRGNIAPESRHVNVAADAPRMNITPDALRVDIAPDALRVDIAPDALRVDIAPDALRVDIAPDALRVDLAPNMLRVGGAFERHSVDGVQTSIFEEDAAPLATDIARGGSTGSASSLPRVFSDLLSRLLDLVQQAPLPLQR